MTKGCGCPEKPITQKEKSDSKYETWFKKHGILYRNNTNGTFVRAKAATYGAFFNEHFHGSVPDGLDASADGYVVSKLRRKNSYSGVMWWTPKPNFENEYTQVAEEHERAGK